MEGDPGSEQVWERERHVPLFCFSSSNRGYKKAAIYSSAPDTLTSLFTLKPPDLCVSSRTLADILFLPQQPLQGVARGRQFVRSLPEYVTLHF